MGVWTPENMKASQTQAIDQEETARCGARPAPKSDMEKTTTFLDVRERLVAIYLEMTNMCGRGDGGA